MLWSTEVKSSVFFVLCVYVRISLSHTNKHCFLWCWVLEKCIPTHFKCILPGNWQENNRIVVITLFVAMTCLFASLINKMCFQLSTYHLYFPPFEALKILSRVIRNSLLWDHFTRSQIVQSLFVIWSQMTQIIRTL